MPEKDSTGRKREYIHGHQGRGKTFSEEVRKTMSLGKKGKYTGENHWNWKGQKYTTDQGYIMTYAPTYPFADEHGRMLEHRLIYETYYECLCES